MSMSLAAFSVKSTSQPAHALVMLHGIYGRGRNWQTIARILVASRPDYTCWLIDLPHHGDSRGGAHGETVFAVAREVAGWLAAERIPFTAILGHSYGGKIALAMAAEMRDRPLQVWVIDSTPEVKPPSGSAWGMLDVVRQLPSSFATREEAIEAIVNRGYARAVAQWMATNLVRQDGSFAWALDFDAMERLLIDFFNTDLWSVVEAPAERHDIHFLKASESSAISEAAVRRIEAASGPHVHLHQRAGGHWIHTESPEVVTSLLNEHLPR